MGSRRRSIHDVHQPSAANPLACTPRLTQVAAAEWYDDWSVTESEVPVEELEGQLMALLQQVREAECGCEE